jgi:hypothetical protein
VTFKAATKENPVDVEIDFPWGLYEGISDATELSSLNSDYEHRQKFTAYLLKVRILTQFFQPLMA